MPTSAIALMTAVAAAQEPLPRARSAGPLGRFDAYVTRAMKDWSVPGLAVAVVRGDSLVFAKGYGVRTLGDTARVDERTLFAVGSTTKAFTATALAMLVDEGKLGWDDPVITYLPAFQLRDPYVTRELTVRDLLTHRSGLPAADLLWYASPYGFDEIMRRLRYLEPVSSLRAEYAYQNIMYAAAGRVVAAVAGTSWDDFVRERIFTPLGMTSTNTSVTALSGQSNVASPHLRVDDTVRVIAYRNLDNIAPAGAINSDVLDMARWIRFQLAGGWTATAGQRSSGSDAGRAAGGQRRRLVDSASFGAMYTPQMLIPTSKYYPAARLANPHFTAYGLGWFLQDYHGRLLAMHTGSIDGMSAIIGLLPEERLGVIVLANLDHAEVRHALMYKVFDLYLNRPPRDWSTDVRAVYRQLEAESKEAESKRAAQRVARTRPSLPLAAYAGRYLDSLYGNTAVRVEKNALVASFGPGFVGDLEHWHFDTFRARWRDRALGTSLITFILNSDGKVGALTIEDLGDFKRTVEDAGPKAGERRGRTRGLAARGR